MGHQDTLGIIDETLFDYLMYNVYLPIQDLDTLLNRTLNVIANTFSFSIWLTPSFTAWVIEKRVFDCTT